MQLTRGKTPLNSRDTTDWLRDQLRKTPAKVIAQRAALHPKTAENIKAGRHGLTMAALVTLCRNDPEFRSQFFRYAGGITETDPDFQKELASFIRIAAQVQR